MYTNLKKENLDMSKKMKDWYKYTEEGSFFGDFYIKGDHSLEGHIIDTPMSNAQRTDLEIKGLIDILKIDNNFNISILDAPCGYGRHTKVLVEKGYQVSCLDINPAFLKRIKENIPNIINVKECELKEIHYEDNSFDIAINMFYSFGFYTNEYLNIQTAKEFYRVLKPGGKFLLHTDVNMNRIETGTYKLQEIRTLEDGGKLFINETYNKNTKRIDGAWSILDNAGHGSAHEYSMRVYSKEEFEMLFRCVGFSKIEIYGSFNNENREYTDNSEEIIFVCTK